MKIKEKGTKKRSLFDKFIDGVEKVGNKLPHPFWLFIALSVVVVLVSALLSHLGVEVTYLKGANGASPEMVTEGVNNLLSGETLTDITMNLPSIYASFYPLGLVITIMLGVGILDKTGMFSALIRKTIMGAPSSMIVAIVALVGICSNIASDAGIIVLPALAAAIFQSMGLNPWVGIFVAYAAADGGWTANLIVGGSDAIIAGITESVVAGLGIDAPVGIMMNYFFIFAATFVIMACIILVTKFYVEPRLGAKSLSADSSKLKEQALTPEEDRGLKFSGIAAIVFLVALLAVILPAGSPFRNAEGGFLPKSPFLSSIIGILFLFFATVGIAYGKGSGAIKSMRDVPSIMQQGLSSSLSFLVIALPAAIFIRLFSASNMSTIIGVSLGQWLERSNIKGFPLIIAFVLICAVFNLFVTSTSAKWIVLAPIFIPAMATLGFSPAFTQASFRIADTCTNIISPIEYYVPVIMGLLAAYNEKPERKVGIGTVVSMMIPYSIAFFIGLIGLLFIFYFFNLPIGPGAGIYL